MKRKLLLILAALLVFGITAGAYAVKTNRAASGKDWCCEMAGCCKDGHCPMKNKQAGAADPTDKPTDTSKVVVMGGDGDDCCKPGSDCCKNGSCCHHPKS
ncbi:MAG TPA: hypothetical protein VEV84_01755 [Pyrinomonadaceae bacterium]|nr:hypothetical protein [Pyrinomonadaceae bacterium]